MAVLVPHATWLLVALLISLVVLARYQQQVGRGAFSVVGSSDDDTHMQLPVDLRVTADGISVTMCNVNYALYRTKPSDYPMFRQLADATQHQCSTVSIDALEQRLETSVDANAVSGFIFHQSRCGSTLLANMLAASPDHVVLSEHPALVKLVSYCVIAPSCDFQRHVSTLLRTVVSASGGRSVVFKMQSALIAHIEDLLAATENRTPWLYLFRDPVEIAASHLRDGSMPRSVGPCIAGRKRPTEQLIQMLQGHEELVSDGEYCVAHLGDMALHAVHALSNDPASLALSYAALSTKPADVLMRVLEHFQLGAEHMGSMIEQSATYSKRGDETGFDSDGQAKRAMLQDDARTWVEKYAMEPYRELMKLATD